MTRAAAMAQTEGPDTGMSGTPTRQRRNEDEDGVMGTPGGGSTITSDQPPVSPTPASINSESGFIRTDPDDDHRPAARREMCMVRHYVRAMYTTFRTGIAE